MFSQNTKPATRRSDREPEPGVPSKTLFGTVQGQDRDRTEEERSREKNRLKEEDKVFAIR